MLGVILIGIFVLGVFVVSVTINVMLIKDCLPADDWISNVVICGCILVLVILNAALVTAYVSSFSICPNCNDVHFGEEYCPECGSSLCAPDIICHKCQTQNCGKNNYCYKCGEELRGESDE
jgi:hypothetical protein